VIDDRTSLLDKGAHQQALGLDLAGPIEPIPAGEAGDLRLSRIPVFTGARVFSSDPQRYHLASALFFESGLGQMQIARLLAMSPQTVAAIIHREQDGMAAERLREVQAKRMAAVVSIASGAMVEMLSDPEARARMSLKDLAYAAKIATESAALLRGEATSRVGKAEEQVSGRAAAADYLATLPEAHVSVGPAQPVAEVENCESREAAEVEDRSVGAGIEAYLGDHARGAT
jgi:predicted transcriptional regulator